MSPIGGASVIDPGLASSDTLRHLLARDTVCTAQDCLEEARVTHTPALLLRRSQRRALLSTQYEEHYDSPFSDLSPPAYPGRVEQVTTSILHCIPSEALRSAWKIYSLRTHPAFASVEG